MIRKRDARNRETLLSSRPAIFIGNRNVGGMSAADLQPENVAMADELATLAALRRGDEAAFARLVEQYHAQLVRFATVYVNDRDLAQEVAQETWLGVLRGLDRFEGRSSLKTWIFRICVNRARTRGGRERRIVPFSALAGEGEPAVEPERFHGADGPGRAGHWAAPPESWESIPEERLLSAETRAVIDAAIERLPPAQRQVILLRDVEGWPADEVCNALELSETNQRVLLHRARAKVRTALEQYLTGA
jgi:RNA polymerase sigma-70 factor (ECF subfamily)